MQRPSPAPALSRARRLPAITRSQARAALDGLAALHDQPGERETLGDRAIEACRAIRDADAGTVSWMRAVLDACAVADESEQL